MSGMTKGERQELTSLIRKREKVMKATADERAATMLADFEAQSAKIYSFDDDEIWKAATEAATEAVKEAEEKIAERCRALGIPVEFAPGLSIGWHGRGQNATEGRRAELRRAAKARIEAITLEAKARIERFSLDAQTEVLSKGLTSEAVQGFLQAMPDLAMLMPPVNAVEIKALIDQRHADDHRHRPAWDSYQ